MAVELASGYVSLSVKLDGTTKGIGGLFSKAQSQAVGAGKKTGEAYTKALESELKTAKEQVEKVTATVVKARDKEADAAGKLKVATEKLNEARDAGVKGSKLTQLETQRESALRRQTAAASELARETDALARSQDRAARAQSKIDAGSGPNRKGILSRFSITGRDSGRAFNAAVSREMGGNALSSAGAAAGQKVKGGFLRTVGKATALAAPFVGVGAIISNGWERMVAIDNAQMKMKQLGLEGQNLEAVMDTVKQSVTGTAFGLGEAATGAAQALAAGVKPGADLAQHLQTIVDTAAYGQVPLEEMATIMNRAKISGKVLSEDLNMLGDRGTPVYAWLQEDLGLAGDELAKFVSDGNLDYEQLNATLQKHAQGAGQRSGETFTGALSNLSAAAGRMGEKLLTPIFKPLQAGVVWLTEGFNKIGPSVEATVTKIAGSISEFVSGKLVPAVQSLMPTIQAMLPVLLDIGKAVIGAFGDAVGFVVKFKDFLIPLVAGLAAYKTAVLVIGAVTKAWAAIQAVLNIALYANPIGLIVAAIAGLVAGIVLAYNKCETFRNIVNAAWNGIKTVIGAVWNWLKTTVFPPMMAIFKEVGTVITAWWRNVVTPAFNGVKAVAGFMWEVVSDIFNNWKKAFQIAGTVAMALWNGAVKPAWDGIKSAFTAAWDFVSPIFDKFKGAWDGLKTGISAAAGAIKDAVTSAFSGLAGIIKAPLKVLGGFMASIPSSVMGFDIPGADKLNEWGRGLQGLKRGGAVRDRNGFLSGPGTGTSDSIFGVNGAGVPIVRVADGEGVVRADVMARGGAAIVSMLNGGMLTGLAGGGTIGGLNPGAEYLRQVIMQQWGDITSIGGYRSEDGYGEHSSGNALDIMIPNWQDSSGLSLGETVASFLLANKSALGLDGMIWRQKSYGYGGGWNGREMEDRGNPTQNHMDHIHAILGKGRGVAAEAVARPVSSLRLPGGGGLPGISGSTSGGSSSGGGYSVGGKTISAETRESRMTSKQESLAKAERDIEISKRELADTEAKGKASATQLERKRNSIADGQAKIDKLKAEIDELESAPFVEGKSDSGSGSGASGGSDPFSQILSGFGQLAQTGLDGITESILPEGFDNPMEWGALKAGGGLLNFFGSLATGSGNPMLGGILGAFGSGITGDMQGVSSAIGGMLSPQEQLGVSSGELSAASVDAGGVVPGVDGTGGGTTYDQSISITNPTATDTVKSTLSAASNKQMGNFRSNFGTKPV